MVVTLDHAARFESLAQTNKERRAAMTAAVRETMQEFERLTNTKDVRFIAGIHLNTENPHAHILVNKNMTDALTGDAKRLDHIPRQLCMHNAEVGKPFVALPDNATHATIISRRDGCDLREGKLAAAMQSALDKRTTDTPAIEADGKLYRRFLTDQPTLITRLVGEYVQAESRFTGRETLGETAHLHTLRERVAQLDTEAREKGQAAPRAYLAPADVTRGIIENRLTPLDKTGAQIERYESPHQSHTAVTYRLRQVSRFTQADCYYQLHRPDVKPTAMQKEFAASSYQIECGIKRYVQQPHQC